MLKEMIIKNFECLSDEEKYAYKRYSNGDLRFYYCPMCGKLQMKNPCFCVNFVKGTFCCQRKNGSGHINELKRYGFDISKVPELVNFKNISYKGHYEKPIEKDMTDIFNNKKRESISNGSKEDFSEDNKKEKILVERSTAMWKNYLAKRGIREKTFRDIVNFDKYNMMIPISNGEKIVGIKYRSMDKYLSCERGSSSAYFMNWQNIKKFNYIIIVEGEIDLLSGLEIGANVVSLPFGAGNIKCVKNQKEWLSKFKNIVIATDNDEEGKRSKAKIVEELKDLKSNLIELDLGEYKDFNEVLTSDNGREKLINILCNSHKKIERKNF